MKQGIYQSLQLRKKEGKKSFAVLIDPDKVNTSMLDELIDLSLAAKVDYFLVGGSLVISNHLDDVVQYIKANCKVPVILFPGSPNQVSKFADALLYLSLISGRNAELLIGQHVVSAPFVKMSGLEIMPSVIWLMAVPQQLFPINNASQYLPTKTEIAMCTAMAGEMLGMKLIYMDSGSGSQKSYYRKHDRISRKKY
jgi:putative glycerol-1-phosphate prenyltransferase